VQDVREIDPADAYDGMLVVDILHHVPKADQAPLADAFARALRPGATLLVKDIASTPRWKRRWNSFHDRLVTGEWFDHTRQPCDWATLFAQAGFEVERSYRLGRLGPYPHFMLRLRRV
jgi:2-polyprenyl-3-methyl-5-hydroxy-6-metoxy-1,4-benzoquinol methylase